MKIRTGVAVWLSIVVVVMVVVGFSMSYFVSEYFKQTILKRDADVNAKFIALQAKQHLTADDFTPTNFDKKDKTFSQFFKEIDTDEIVRIKVWSPDQTLVYSDDKSIVGKTFHDNDELDEALGGDVVSEISDLQKSESTSEKNFTRLMEMYVPVKSDSGKVIGVIETYASMNLVDTYIESANKIIMIISGVGVAIVGLLILLTFGKLSRNVINPIVGIHNQTKTIAEGMFDVRSEPVGYEEIKKLGKEVEVMASRLKEQRIRIVKAERLSAIGELAARLAHDLRNPLSVIRNGLLLIRYKYGTDKGIVKDFDRIDRSISRMSHQLENVMDFVTTKDLELQTSSLNEIIKNAMVRANLPESIEVSLPEEDIMLDCDPAKMEIAIDNVLVNARQAIEKSGTIDIRTGRSGDSIYIEIQDSGKGMPSEILANIFEPLFTTKQEGTGLGLSSCKNIIEQHGGKITVTTEEGRGTTFIIYMPARSARVHAPEISVMEGADTVVSSYSTGGYQ